MSFWTQYRELRKQCKDAYRDMQNKRSQIICSGRDINTQDNVCLKVYPFPVFGMLNDDTIKTIELDHCGMFVDNKYCPCNECEMSKKNHEYIDAVKLYRSVESAKWNLVKDALKLRKH